MSTRWTEPDRVEGLILEHLPDIVTLCNRMLRQPSDAQDAAHQAVLAILRALPTYRGDGPLRHWVLKVALNAARQHRRSLGRTARREAVLPPEASLRKEAPNAVPTNPLDDREQQEALRAAIAALPQELREPIVLHYHHGLAQTAVAEIVGCSQKTVSLRLAKGRERLRRELAGSAVLAGVLAAGAAGASTLDAVPAAVVATVKQAVAAHVAASAGAAAATTTATATTLATGGVVMQGKLIAGAVVLTVAGLVGGLVLSDRIMGAERDRAHRSALAEAEARVAGESAQIDTLRDEMEAVRKRSGARVEQLSEQTRRLRDEVAERDAQIAALQAEADAAGASATAGGAGDGAAPTRTERWEALLATMAPVLRILEQMGEPGANQFALGPQMVGELGKLTTTDFDAIVAFDADETDPAIVADIRSVMLQALTFVPAVAPHRDAFMERYIDRTNSGIYGNNFAAGALRQISFTMPPFVDAYAKLVEPLDESLRTRLTDMAVERATSGANASLRMDGVSFLRRVDDPRATAALVDAARLPTNDPRVRLTALKGLARRTDDETAQQVLRDVAAADQDADLRAAATKLLDR